jgi:hypothetical protein
MTCPRHQRVGVSVCVTRCVLKVVLLAHALHHVSLNVYGRAGGGNFEVEGGAGDVSEEVCGSHQQAARVGISRFPVICAFLATRCYSLHAEVASS